jgi:diketogulonate reductase-like aldo/keto reductase
MEIIENSRQPSDKERCPSGRPASFNQLQKLKKLFQRLQVSSWGVTEFRINPLRAAFPLKVDQTRVTILVNQHVR